MCYLFLFTLFLDYLLFLFILFYFIHYYFYFFNLIFYIYLTYKICEGESQYLADLNITRRIFMTPLQSMLHPSDVQTIFSNLIQVFSV